MKKGKYQRAGSKALAVILAVILVMGSVIGGTVAWLIAETEAVTNTFTYGDINIELDETKRDENGNTIPGEDGNPIRTDEGNEYEMIPGQDIEKDPEVRVLADSEDAWVFVKIEEKGGKVTVDGVEYSFDDFLTYELAEGWTQLLDAEGNPVEGVYYRTAWQAEEVQKFNVLKDNTVTVKDTVTKDMLNALNPEDAEASFPQLIITAYAVQYAGFEPEISEGAEEATAEQVNDAALAAWEKVEEANTPANP